jgi:serine/threonine protein kinase
LTNKDKLHRRTISDTLKREDGWPAKSTVEGFVEVRPFAQHLSVSELRDMVVSRVRGLGYNPTVIGEADASGRPCIRFHTPETLAQAGRGAHGYAEERGTNRESVVHTREQPRLSASQVDRMKEVSQEGIPSPEGTERPPDRILGGRYRLGKMIGRGGMGAVFAAVDERLERPVAIKLISVLDVTEEQREVLRTRFHREARAAARIAHPNVVTVFDFGTDDASGLEYLVMELLEGEDLAAWMLRSGPGVGDRLRILRDAARGVGAGHRAGLVHRDVKPANIYISRDAAGIRVRVLDFGIAAISSPDATATQLTAFGTTALTPAYAAPEQFHGRANPSPAADVFSLGRVGFELFTGRRAYAGVDWTQTAPHAPPPVPSVHAFNPSVPAHVAAAIQQALAFHPENRPRNADTFAALLAGSDREMSEELLGLSARSVPRPMAPRSGTGEWSRTEAAPLPHVMPWDGISRTSDARELRGKVLRIAPEVLQSGNPRRPFTHGWLAFEILYRAGDGSLPFDEYRRRLFHPAPEIRTLAAQIPGVPNGYQDLKHIRHDIKHGRVLVE